MISDEINSELRSIDTDLAEMKSNINKNAGCSDNTDTVLRFDELNMMCDKVSGNQKKKYRREMSKIRATNPEIDVQYTEYMKHRDFGNRLERENKCRENTANYMRINIDTMVNHLQNNEFVEYSGLSVDELSDPDLEQMRRRKLTHFGLLARVIREIHPLAFVDTYIKNDGFRGFEYETATRSIAIVLASFSELRTGSDDDDSNHLHSNITVHIDGSETRKETTYIPQHCVSICKDYEITEVRYKDMELKESIETNEYKKSRLNHLDLFAKWFDAKNVLETESVLVEVTKRGVFVGDFVKELLKIVNLSREVEMMCEIDCNMEVKSHISKIPELILKSIVTNNSLYID